MTRVLRKVVFWSYYQEFNVDNFLFKSDVAIGHDLLKPFHDLHEWGLANGIEFLTLDKVATLGDIDAVVFMERPPANHPAANFLISNIERKYLLIFECPVIKPDNWDVDFHRQFKCVFTWNDALIAGGNYRKINFAIDPAAKEVEALPFCDRALAVLMAGNKKSNHPNELYSHRERLIRWFELNAPGDLSLYGGGWSSSEHPCYKGFADNKLSVYSKYKFSICYENAQGYPGYITEKILDCFKAGVVPIYGGAPNIKQWIPEECFIDINQFQSYRELYNFMTEMSEADYDVYRDNINSFLISADFEPFSIKSFVNIIGSKILSDLGEDLVAASDSLGVTLSGEDANGVLKQHFNLDVPNLIVYIGYGFDLPIYKRARELWQLYASFLPNIKLVFVRDSTEYAKGHVFNNGYDLVVGCGSDSNSDSAGYAQTGKWSPRENSIAIGRQISLYKYLLEKNPEHFYIYHTTITSMVDFRALAHLIRLLPKDRCYAGSTGRLNSPDHLSGLIFTSGANTLFSRDMMELLIQRYDPSDPLTCVPNDVWQAQTLSDIPRIPLPSFNFVKPRTPTMHSVEIMEETSQELKEGHFHFRVKTTSEEEGVGERADVDLAILMNVMATILSKSCNFKAVLALKHRYSEFIAAEPVDQLEAYANVNFYGGPRAFYLSDDEML